MLVTYCCVLTFLLFTVKFEKVAWRILGVYLKCNEKNEFLPSILMSSLSILFAYLNIHQVAHFCLCKYLFPHFTKSIVTQSLQNFYIDWRNCFVLMYFRPITCLCKILRYDVTEKGNQWQKRMCYRSKYGGKYILTIYVILCAIGCSEKEREEKLKFCAAGIITYYTCMCFIIPPCRAKYVISCRGSFLGSTISYQVSRTGW